ncbi:MAG: ISL3 family transposase [Bacteroidales bacterium]|nr:ISL3 family transposase [Bacteroidales bacterium]
MKQEDLFTIALGLQDPWFVEKVEFVVQADTLINELHIQVNHRPGQKFTTEDGKEYPIYDHVERTWRHLNFFQHECYLHARVPRVKNKEGNTLQVDVPWAKPGSSFTLLFEAFSLFLLQAGSSLTSAGELMKVDSRVIGRIVNYYVAVALSNEKLEPVEALGIDETSIKKGHNYITVLTDLERKKVVAVSPGKDGVAVGKSLEIMSKRGAQPKDVKKVAMDLSIAYTSAVMEKLPQAAIIYDRFHLEQLLSKALDTIRKQEQAENQILRKTKYLWLRNSAKLTQKQSDRIHYLSITFPNLGKAYLLKEQFKEIYNNAKPSDALVALKEWIRLARKSELAPLQTFVNTLKAHWSGIVTYFHTRLTSAFAERTNLKIQEIKRTAKGYRNLNNYIAMIYFHCGGLNLPTHN